jgi:hypothetical protein
MRYVVWLPGGREELPAQQGHRELWVLATALERKVGSTANGKGKVA